MADHDHVQGPSELVYAPAPSWAAPFAAVGITSIIFGLFSSFLLPGWFYTLVGVVIVVAALRSMVAGVLRNFFRLPRRQQVRGAVLPATTLRVARRSDPK